MSYAMALDNSWDVMCEEEMYDVNGGWSKKVNYTSMNGFFDNFLMVGLTGLSSLVALSAATLVKIGIGAIIKIAGGLYGAYKLAVFAANLVAAALSLTINGSYNILSTGISVFGKKITLYRIVC